MARPYAYAICGKPLEEKHKNGVFKLKYFADRKCFNKNTELYLSEDFYFPDGFEAKFGGSCKGCKLQLLKGWQKSYYEILLTQESFNRTIEV